MTIDTAIVPVRREFRDWILSFAGCLLEPGSRKHAAVIEKAGPLLDWAASASSREDLRARMTAMDHAHRNDQARIRSAVDAQPRRLAPAEFLAEADAYYRFITGEA